ncbi:MAG TPA: FtsX-like permease family protein [Dehalococcoidia bacterium]|nr:FtsX-like permease family protein [Dehalococcoidia bacterium]
MMLLALRNLVSEKTRFAFSAAGIGFAVFLITVLIGLYQGWNQKVGGFVEDVRTDLWVAREGTTDFINAASILPEDIGQDVAARDGVAATHPLIVRPMQFDKGDKRVELHLIGYDTGSGTGGPVRITKGKAEPGAGEIIIDDVLSKTSGVGVGDVLSSGDASFTVVGIASGGNFAFTQAGFMDIETASDLLSMDGLVTFWLVGLDDGADATAIGQDIMGAHQGSTVFTSAEFASATRHRILDNVVPIIGLIVGLAFIVGIAVTSLTIYTATVEKTREFGIMKAVGFNNRDLYRLVLIQSFITGIVGFVVGVALTLVLSQFIDQLVAQFIVYVRPIDIALVLVSTMVMAGAAAIVPARRVGAVDPAVAFKG